MREGPHGVNKYAVRFLPGRPKYAPSMHGVDTSLLKTYQLIIFFIDKLDDTEFRCVIEIPTYPREKWPSAVGRILVKWKPEILPQLTSLIVNEGEALRLNCSAQGSPYPNISWTRANGKPLDLVGSPQRIYELAIEEEDLSILIVLFSSLFVVEACHFLFVFVFG
ncbi:unnamed protein product [Protopolystoma xenopodis]|uniref:Ig-like domain-containing protein n=1 Tax=Protopolystoma xenopodis TaxID=117903 RepID=A0A3S5AJ31_9PLAT|nr:unnamed protein product [Protopolystoma xenopodis]